MNYFLAQRDTVYNDQDAIKSPIQDTIKITTADTNKPSLPQKIFKPKSIIIQDEIKISKYNLDSSYYKFEKTKESIIDNYIGTKIGLKDQVTPIPLDIQNSEKPSYSILQNHVKHSITSDIQNRIQTENGVILFLFTFIGLVLLSVVSATYKKYLNILFESTLFKYVSSKLTKGKTQPINRMFIILDLLYFLSFSLWIITLLTRTWDVIMYKSTTYSFFLIILGLMGLRLFKYVVHKLILKLTGYKELITELYHNALLFTRAASMILIPILFLAIYSKGSISEFLFYLTLFVVGISLLMRTLRMFILFMDFGFSIFYFILYLCALEFVPVLFIWWGINS